MLRISKQTHLTSEQVLDRAAEFFGPNGHGLDEKDRDSCCISFEGGGGFVTVTVSEQADSRSVEIETREHEYQAKAFLGGL
jgi:hypothetical protein